jgi:hypothetical protein
MNGASLSHEARRAFHYGSNFVSQRLTNIRAFI